MRPLRNLSPEEHTVVVTGASAGMGEATARRFAADGAKVIAVGRRAERLAVLAGDAAGNGAIHPLPLDIRDESAVRQAFSSLPGDFADVTVLINSAGLALGLGKVPDTELDDWQVMIDTNIKGVVHCTHALLPGMVERNCGHVINVGSIAGSYPYPGGNVYGATKAFTHQFSLNLKADLLGTNVRVTSFEPGMTRTEFATVRFKGDAETAAKNYQGVEPLTADDVADLIAYIVYLPTRVNINTIEIMPLQQAFAGYAFDRRDD